MHSSAVVTETEIADSGKLHDGRRWYAFDSGYQCELDTATLETEYCSGCESARIKCDINLHTPEIRSALNDWLDWLFQNHKNLDRVCLEDGEEVNRGDFYQCAGLWYRGSNAGRFPLSWEESVEGLRHPRRPQAPAGEVYRRHFYSLGMDFSLRRLDPARDLERFTNWMNQPRVAEFWEEQGDAEKQRRYIEAVLADPHKDPLIASFGDSPFAYFEVYWALEDRLGPYYDAEPFDRGLHLLVGETEFLGSRFAHAWLSGIFHFMYLDDDRTQRLVGEPRADNIAILKYIQRMPGWRKVKEFDFPHKRAALVMCEREGFFRGLGVL